MPLFCVNGAWIHIHGNVGKPCAVCHYFAGKLCDWRLPNGRTCDMPLCGGHAFSPAPEKDICPLHEGFAKAWLAGRTNSTDGAGA